MKAVEFCYWLQGYFEIADASPKDSKAVSLTSEQVAIVRNHLALVFRHDIDPKAGPPEYQQELQALHDGKPIPPPVWNQPGKPSGGLYRC